jgi:SAM-dependent methyltransferase
MRAAREGLRRYRSHGPDPTTRELIEAISREGIEGASVLDIGGGVGAIQLELLDRGAASAESVDASPPYVEVAKAEAARRGYADRTVHREGDFVALAAAIPDADIVTLDRMICCYGDMPALAGLAAAHARRMIGFVYPRDAWPVRVVASVVNGGDRLLGRAMRWHVHSERALHGLLTGAGFERRVLDRHLLWQVALYVRST